MMALLLELPTGYGKSKLALNKIEEKFSSFPKTLIVIPRLVLINSWKQEIKKWGYKEENFVFSTYISLAKHAGEWDAVIFDEAHHLSERCIEALASFKIRCSILLSASIGRNKKEQLRSVFTSIKVETKSLKEAIREDKLPTPQVITIPLTLNNTINNCVIKRNVKGKLPVLKYTWNTRFQGFSEKKHQVEIWCTQQQYYSQLENDIEYYKQAYFRTNREPLKFKWLKLCSDRLKWLSDLKIPKVKQLLQEYSSERVLTFCNSIEQTEQLGQYCINSKNKQSQEFLQRFNEGKINHITAVNMLNEGVNLTNCRIGIYSNLNSSDTIVIQRLGRLLRHPNPLIIIPYFKGTREEELISKYLINV